MSITRSKERAFARALMLSAGTGAGLMAAPAVVWAQAAQIEIPAGPLSSALNLLAAQTGLQIGYDSQLTGGLSTQGLSGSYEPEAALDTLLAGTGLEARSTGPNTVTLAAATGAAEIGDAGDAVALAPIIITGEKFAREPSRTYTSVGVATEEQIVDFNIENLESAINRMPNVTSLPSGTGDARITIRGLNAEGVTQPSRSAPIISVIVDGAQQGIETTRRGSRGLWDVEQVEVLRGPQSTIQGRNALGGAVIVETRDPTYAPEAIIEADAGTNDTLGGAFAISAPIVDNQLAFRIAGQVTRQEKDIDYVNPAFDDLGEDEFEEFRGKLLFEPESVPGLSALLTVSYTHDKPAWNLVSGPDFQDREFDDPTATSIEFRDTKVFRYIAELNYELSSGAQITSITAFSDTDVSIGTPSGVSFDRDDTRNAQDISQDLRLTFNSSQLGLSGVVGLFAGHFQTDLKSNIATNQLAGFGIPSAIVQDLDGKTETTTFAAYADLRYEVTDRITLLAGGRIQNEKVAADFRGQALDINATQFAIGACFLAGIGCPPAPVYGSLDEKNSVTKTVFLPKLGVAFDINDDNTIAATVNRGYRSGFSEAIPGTGVINQVNPEYLWSYELAWRSRWLDDTLEINANGFYYDYDNQQILTLNPAFPGQTITRNGGASHAYGLEVDARWRPTAELQVYGALGLLKTEFDKGSTSLGNIKGSEFPESPSITASLGAAYRHESGVFASADATYTDSYYSFGDVPNTSAQKIDPFTVVNAQIGYDFGNASIALYARNLFDNSYLTSINSAGNQATIGDDFMVGLKMRARF